MRVLFLNSGAEMGGAERLLIDLIASFRDMPSPPEMHLLVGADGPLVHLARKLGVQTAVLPMPESLAGVGDSGLRDGRGGILRLAAHAPAAVWGAWRYLHRVKNHISSISPDVIHSNSIKFHVLTSLIRPARSLLIWHIHDFLGSRAVVARALRWLPSPRGAIAVSRAVADDVSAVLLRVPVAVVYNAIDVEHFRPGPSDPGRLDDLAGLSPASSETIRVGLIATYAKWKGQDVFLDAAARLCDGSTDRAIRFYVIGGPIYRTAGSQWTRAELHLRIARIEPNRIGFVDFQSDPVDVYRDLDIVVHASRRPEPFGLTVVEAMACGRAVIVSNAGGASELFEDGADAVGVPPNDSEVLAERIRQLARNGDLRAELGRAARASATKKFSRSRLGDEVLAAYEEFRARNLR